MPWPSNTFTVADHTTATGLRVQVDVTAINPGDTVEEKASLSDRFGLWIGFHPVDQDTYLAMVASYVRHFAVAIEDEALRTEALQWAMTRGARSGRVAWQFVQQLRGRE